MPTWRRLPAVVVGLLIAILGLAAAAAHAAGGESQRYCNGRFGFCVEYPRALALVPEPEPVNHDGRRFHNEEGFLMIVSGIHNVLDGTVASEMAEDGNHFDKVVYKAKGENWFVLSGIKGTDILYIKTYVGRSAVNHLWMQYPAALKDKYDPIVTAISRSFKPGKLN